MIPSFKFAQSISWFSFMCVQVLFLLLPRPLSVPTHQALGSGRAREIDKAAALSHMVSLVCQSREALDRVAKEVTALCTDLGTEQGLATCQMAISDVAPKWWRTHEFEVENDFVSTSMEVTPAVSAAWSEEHSGALPVLPSPPHTLDDAITAPIHREAAPAADNGSTSGNPAPCLLDNEHGDMVVATAFLEDAAMSAEAACGRHKSSSRHGDRAQTAQGNRGVQAARDPDEDHAVPSMQDEDHVLPSMQDEDCIVPLAQSEHHVVPLAQDEGFNVAIDVSDYEPQMEDEDHVVLALEAVEPLVATSVTECNDAEECPPGHDEQNASSASGFLPSALPIAGLEHISNNLTMDIHAHLSHWALYLKDLHVVSSFLTKRWRRERFIMTCLADSPLSVRAHEVAAFSQTLY